MMRSQWTVAVLVSATLIAGCNGRSNDNSQNFEQNQTAAPAIPPAAGTETAAPAAAAPPAQSYTPGDRSAARQQVPAAGRRETPAPRGTTAARNQSAYNEAPEVGLSARDSDRAAAAAPPAVRAPQWRE